MPGHSDEVTVASHASGLSQRTRALVAPEVVASPAEPRRRIDLRCALLLDPWSRQSRSFRLLRHRLLAAADPRIIAVTSARDGEGKTTCAINLALCIADEPLTRVLLLEANPRRPSLADALEGTPSRGSDDGAIAPIGAQVRRVYGLERSDLFVASADPRALNHGGLDRALLREFVGELRGAYHYIVVDTGSVLESADADVACECAEAVLLVARAGRSCCSSVERAMEQIVPATLAGVVLLDV